MDNNLKKMKYQELFLSELRNSYFGEKKREELFREIETEENIKKLGKALKDIWKQTDANVKDLEEAFKKPDFLDKSPDIRKVENVKVKRSVNEFTEARPTEKLSPTND